MTRAKDIDAILPQTQCTLCGFNGCMPYAKALAANQANIDLCPPGGIKGLIKIAEKCGVDPNPFIPEMKKKAKPIQVAVIKETECIGCTKCIDACPVDAILGAGKQMHTIITKDCTGCELCIAPCPVDCIEMIKTNEDENDFFAKSNYFREKYETRNQRLLKSEKEKKQIAKPIPTSITEKQSYIQAALERIKEKKK